MVCDRQCAASRNTGATLVYGRILDSTINQNIIKNKPESVLQHLKAKQSGGLAVSAIMLAALEYGVAASMFPEKNALA